MRQVVHGSRHAHDDGVQDVGLIHDEGTGGAEADDQGSGDHALCALYELRCDFAGIVAVGQAA